MDQVERYLELGEDKTHSSELVSQADPLMNLFQEVLSHQASDFKSRPAQGAKKAEKNTLLPLRRRKN